MPKLSHPSRCEGNPALDIVFLVSVSRKHRAKVFEQEGVLQLFGFAADIRLLLLLFLQLQLSHLLCSTCPRKLLLLFRLVQARSAVYVHPSGAFTWEVTVRASLPRPIERVQVVRHEVVLYQVLGQISARLPAIFLRAITLPPD